MAYNWVMKWRNILISCFVVVWVLFFHYQTFRLSYLSPYMKQTFGIELPKVPLLFPPAGWIMFFNVDPAYGFAEVYGIAGGEPHLLDPHDILETRAVGYDNIHRNVLVGVLYSERAAPFCRFLDRKFPSYESFAVAYGQYTDLIGAPERISRRIMYRCP